jgi:hypothetical protein
LRKEACLTDGSARISDTIGEGKRGSALLGQRCTREPGRGRERGSAQAERDARVRKQQAAGNGPRDSEGKQAAGEEMGCRTESEGNEDFRFLFPFQLFQSIFK